MFSHNAQDVQIKQEPILDETKGPQPFINPFIKQENTPSLDDNILYAMGNDLLPKNKRLRTEETENLNTMKRLKTREGVPNFRRPWPTTIKSSALYPNTNESNSSHSYTNFSISNLIQDKNPGSKEMIDNDQLQNATSYNNDLTQNGFAHGVINTNLIKKEPNVHASYENRSHLISEVQNDLNITNDSEDEHEYSSNFSGISEKESIQRFDSEANEETYIHNKSNDSNLFWTVQNGNAEQLKLVISKENDTSNAKNISKINKNYKILDTDEQPLKLAHNKNKFENKYPDELSKPKADIMKLVHLYEATTPISKMQSETIDDDSIYTGEKPLDIPNNKIAGDMKHKILHYDSKLKHSKLVSSKENKKHKSKKKSKRKEKKTENENQEVAINSKENINVYNYNEKFSNSIDESAKLIIAKETKKHKSGKKSKRKEKDNIVKNKQLSLLPIIENKTQGKTTNEIFSAKCKEETIIKLESSFERPPVGVVEKLQVSTPLRDLKKNKSSIANRRYSLPNSSKNLPSANDSPNHHVSDKKISQPPRVFMKKIKWTSILQKEKMYTDTRVKIHKMIFCQEDGTTSEIAIKAHLEGLDWTSLGLVPRTMIVEEGAAIANLQGIKGIPYLCGVIIEDPPALVMSYYKGRTLGDYLEEGDTLLALRAFSRACEIVGKIHHRGWAHYDLHADNILGRVNHNNSMTVTLLNFGFCRKTSVNPHYGIYCDSEDLEGHHLPVDIIEQKCNGTYVDRYSLCYILEEITSQLKEVPETADIRDVASLGLTTEQPNLRPSSSHLAQLVSKLVSKQTHDTWKLGIDD